MGRAALISAEVPPSVPMQLPPPAWRTGLLGSFAEQCCSQMVNLEIKARGATTALALTSKSKSVAFLQVLHLGRAVKLDALFLCAIPFPGFGVGGQKVCLLSSSG